MTLLGVTFNFSNPHYSLLAMDLYGRINKMDIDLYHLADFDLLESFIHLNKHRKYTRVVIYDIDELETWDRVRELVNICSKYNLEFSIIKQDIHSDVEVPIGYLTNVI